MSNVKIGATLYCFTKEYVNGEFSLEDCIRTAKEMGAEGYELVATQMNPSYPYVSDEFLGELKAISSYYDIDMCCYSANMDCGVRGDRRLTENEKLAMAINDVKSAAKIGAPVIREQYLIGPATLVRLAPYCEEYGVKVGIEIHNPETTRTPIMLDYLERIKESGSKYIGFVPDFGMFATAPNKPHWDAALAAGEKPEVLELAKQMRIDGVPQDEAVAKLKEAGAGPAALQAQQGMYGFVQFKADIQDELDGLVEMMPYVFHMHGKFHYLYEDLHEASIPYDRILKTIATTDYDGFIVSEYEDHDSGNALVMTERHLGMMKKLLGR